MTLETRRHPDLDTGAGGDDRPGEVFQRPVPGAAADEDRRHWRLPSGVQKGAEIALIVSLFLLAAACTTPSSSVDLDEHQCRYFRQKGVDIPSLCKKPSQTRDQTRPTSQPQRGGDGGNSGGSPSAPSAPSAPSGPSGGQGPQGPTGPQGPSGPPGSPGSPGAPGTPGTPGQPGTPGGGGGINVGGNNGISVGNGGINVGGANGISVGNGGISVGGEGGINIGGPK